MWPHLALLVLAANTCASTNPRQKPSAPPSAASFYVPNIPNLKRDPSSPLHIWAGHLNSDPKAKPEPTKEVSAHLYFVLTKARRTADKERLIIWLNVRKTSRSMLWLRIDMLSAGGAGLFFI